MLFRSRANKKRGRPQQYGIPIAEALRIAWEATDRLCSKRLRPFLPELVKVLKRHGDRTMTAEIETQLCQMSPSTIDRLLHARRLFPNFYICLVGRTAITRKDTARCRAQRLLNDLHSEENPENPQFQILPGIGSAEGLLDALGGERKVVVLSESELLSLLAKARQEALSNLIPKLTSLFDCPDLETFKTRQRTVVCKEPFLSISSGTTLAWLQKALTEKDIYGGFANRFIFVYGNPKPPLPFPPKVDADAYTALLAKINDMRLWAERLRQSEAGGELTVPDTTQAK